MSILPPGFTFKPSKEELVNHYLRRKHYGHLSAEENVQDDLVVPDHFIIPDVYVYDYDPWELQELFREKSLAQLDNGECYFFCLRCKKHPRGNGENRATKSGYWKSRGEKKTIRTSQITAEKIGLTFYQGQQRNSIVTEYKMHQYRLVSDIINDNSTSKEMPYDLCHIFMKKTKHDQGYAPVCKEGNSSTFIISTANNSEIYNSQFQNDHQGDQRMELGETYGSQPPIYFNTKEICRTQMNYDVARESAIPSTNYAYEVDQLMESEEIYRLLQPQDNSFNVI